MTIESLLGEAKKQLENKNSDFLGVELILSHVNGLGRHALITKSDVIVSPEQEKQFWSLFEKFYAGEPVAYLINKKEFYGLEFYVDKRVLIPRPETEMLVEEVIATANKLPSPVKVLDVGTGSGCIAVSIAKNCPKAQITAVDISSEALEVAGHNIQNHQLKDRIQLLQSDLLEKIEEPFDIVVANLPYIGEKNFNFVSKEAQKYEPSVALFGGEDGLELYRKLFTQFHQKSWKPKLLLGEFGFLQGEEMQKMLNQSFGQGTWKIYKDLAGIERIFLLVNAQ